MGYIYEESGSISGGPTQTLTSGPYPSTGFVPVMTNAERAASNPGIGSMIFCSDTNKLWVYDGAWVQIN